MKKIKINDLVFKRYIKKKSIQKTVSEMADVLNFEFDDVKDDVLFVPVLNGALPFAMDLFKKVNFPVQLDTVKVSSYNGGTESGELKMDKEIGKDVKGRTVLIVEDIVDTGKTIDFLRDYFLEKGASAVYICTLLFKMDVYRENHPDIDWDGYSPLISHFLCGYVIPNDFVVGYGMDYDEKGRNLNDIFAVEN